MKNEKGTAMIEFVITFPFFLILLFGIIDIFFMVQKQQYLSVAVREAGSAAYRQCSAAQQGAPTYSCLQNSIIETLTFINNNGGVIDGANILVTSWEINEATNPTFKGEFKTNNFQSRYSALDVRNLNSYDTDLRETIIVVEILLDGNTNLTPFFSRNLYESMIF